jgi:hypothetical protein
VKIGYRGAMKLFSALLVTVALTTSAFADDFDKFLAWFSGLTDQVVADQNDCNKLAGDINTSVAANKDIVDHAKTAAQSGQKMTPDQQQKVMPLIQKFAGAVAAKCAQDKSVQAAMKNLPRPGH